MQVWVATESGNLEATYTHNEEHVHLYAIEHILVKLKIIGPFKSYHFFFTNKEPSFIN